MFVSLLIFATSQLNAQPDSYIVKVRTFYSNHPLYGTPLLYLNADRVEGCAFEWQKFLRFSRTNSLLQPFSTPHFTSSTNVSKMTCKHFLNPRKSHVLTAPRGRTMRPGISAEAETSVWSKHQWRSHCDVQWTRHA